MFVSLTNTPRDYAWGSTTAIADLLGRVPSGGPEAEYWLGTHPGSPSVLVDGPRGARLLSDLTQLPFIMKVLAAQTPVSLQAHPSTEQAEEGFARENALGVPLDAPHRDYKDPRHKPELLYAVGEPMDALCGFRPVAATREILGVVGDDPVVARFLERLVDDSSLKGVFEWLISFGPGVPELLARILELAPGQSGIEFATVLSLANQYPGDAGILISLLLNQTMCCVAGSPQSSLMFQNCYGCSTSARFRCRSLCRTRRRRGSLCFVRMSRISSSPLSCPPRPQTARSSTDQPAISWRSRPTDPSRLRAKPIPCDSSADRPCTELRMTRRCLSPAPAPCSSQRRTRIRRTRKRDRATSRRVEPRTRADSSWAWSAAP
jgi:hypothetical protein